MGHYDSCRDGYCPSCGAAPGNIYNGICEFCSKKVLGKKNKSKKSSYNENLRVVKVDDKYYAITGTDATGVFYYSYSWQKCYHPKVVRFMCLYTDRHSAEEHLQTKLNANLPLKITELD